MDSDEPDDRIIREQEFKRSSGVDFGDIDIPEDKETVKAEDVDQALGEFFDPFSEPKKDPAGAVNSEGPVESPPDRDLVTVLSSDGEKRISWILMGSMIVLYSAISIQVGRAFEDQALLGSFILIFLAIVGFGLGEIWIPRKRMVLLGVTWVIISMKVLYGLAIELRNWGVIGDDLSLGVLLLILVSLNIYIAYRHDQDAIAAQSTLVLLAIGSTAGTEFGEGGVAAMILISTILLHGLAINRKSGNLASLGIASSNLWIGMHAVTSKFEIGPLEVLPIEEPLLLFLLLMVVTALNAFMATRFAREENWFSRGFEAVGLGKPGLWGVSISLGMIGSSLAVASNREDIGYALGMVTFLGGAFGGSYLVVRGVDSFRVAQPLILAGTFLTIVLLGGDSIRDLIGLTKYQFFTVIGSCTTIFIIIRDQDSVSDRVLWLGSVVILGILVILVPAEPSSSGGDGGATLLAMLTMLHLGTAFLAVRRNSPSLSGVTVLLPWTWIIVEKSLEEVIRTVMLARDVSETSGIIDLSPGSLSVYLAIASILLFFVNFRLGDKGVNLASGFLGITEISASIRDSEILNLWNIGLWLPMLTILLMAQFGGFTSSSIVFLFALLSGLHVISLNLGIRKGGGRGILWVLSFTCLVIQWRHGLDQSMALILCVSVTSILYYAEDEIFGLGLGVMTIPVLVILVGNNPANGLGSPEWYYDFIGDLVISESAIAVLCTAIILAVYLPRADKMEQMLKPASSALVLLVLVTFLASRSGDVVLQISSVGMFVSASIWLISKGELRSELKSIAKKEAIIGLASSAVERSSAHGAMSTYSPKIAEMQELRKKMREKPDTDDISELLTSDISHTPVVGLVIIGIVLVASIILSALGKGPLVLVAAGVFCCIICLLIRNRSRGLELELPHILGMEMPIAMTISGICLCLVSAHVIPVGSSPNELLDMAVVSVLVLVLSTISLLHQKNLIERILIAIDWFVFPLLLSRIAAAVILEGLPFPLVVDPFDGEMLDWKGPWFLLESILILSVILGNWVEIRRSSRVEENLDGTSRSVRSIGIVLLSFGPAGIMAAVSACYWSIKDSQPNGLGVGIPSAVLAMVSIASWNSGVLGLMAEFVLILGALLIVLCALTVPLKLERWTFVLAVDGHIFALIGSLSLGMIGDLYLPMLMVVMSTVVWIVGILQLRKSLRIWGLLDLIAAVLVSIVFSSGEIFQQNKLLLGMAILAIELGVVAWLGLENQDEMAND